MSRQQQLQEYFDQEPVRQARGGSEVNLFLAGSPGNGLAVKVPHGPQPKMHRTIRRHTNVKHAGGDLVVPFEHLDKLELNPSGAEGSIRVYNPIVQELVAQNEVIDFRLRQAVQQEDLETIKRILHAVTELREKLLQTGIILIDPIPSNLALKGDKAQLLDVSAAETLGRQDTIRIMSSFFMASLSSLTNIWHYRSHISRNLLKALGPDWENFKKGMRQFHNPDYLQRTLPSRKAFRDRHQPRAARKNGSPDHPVPDVRIPRTSPNILEKF